MIELKVESCRKCPFVTNDSEYGYVECNASGEVSASLMTNINGRYIYAELPGTGVHELCPLKKDAITVNLK